MALTTPAEVRQKHGVPASISDAELSASIAAVTGLINAYLGYDPEGTTITEYLDPNGSDTLTLGTSPGTPVTITSVYEDYERAWTSDTLLTAGTDYQQVVEGGKATNTIVRLNTVWGYTVRGDVKRLGWRVAHAIGIVKVVYAATNTAALAVAKRCALMEIGAALNAEASGGLGVVTSDSMDGASVKVGQAEGYAGRRNDSLSPFISPLVSRLLGPFRKLPLG